MRTLLMNHVIDAYIYIYIQGEMLCPSIGRMAIFPDSWTTTGKRSNPTCIAHLVFALYYCLIMLKYIIVGSMITAGSAIIEFVAVCIEYSVCMSFKRGLNGKIEKQLWIDDYLPAIWIVVNYESCTFESVWMIIYTIL